MNFDEKNGFSRKQFMKNVGGAIFGGGLLAGAGLPLKTKANSLAHMDKPEPVPISTDRIGADPTDIPGPNTYSSPRTHEIELVSNELTAEIEDGVQFQYMTFCDQVPGPMIRVRQGDTVIFTLRAAEDSAMLHNIDFHAVYGTGGGANATYVTPGQSKTIKFKAMYPGAFIYHCAVPEMDYHISSGMYGMIVVEPEDGLPEVDHEFYLGQNELYTQQQVGTKGLHEFSKSDMQREDATYVLLNGEKYGLTDQRHGPMKVKKGETARIFFVNGGPNLASSLHPIGNVWTKAWREGAIASNPEKFVQTALVPPGSCGIFEMDFPVPSTIHIVDHALSRVANKGMRGDIVVEGEEEPDIYNPNYSS